MTQGKREGPATWLKITIAVLLLGLVSFVGLLIAGGMFAVDALKKATDPKYVSNVAESVAKINDPLPEGFTRIAAVDIMGMTEVSFANKKAGLSIMLMKMQNNPSHSSADYFVDSYVKSGGPNAPGVGGLRHLTSPPVIQSKSTISVGGEEMPYAIAERKFNGISTFQMVGCVVPVRTGRPIVILGQASRSSASYPMESTKKFLAAIQSF